MTNHERIVAPYSSESETVSAMSISINDCVNAIKEVCKKHFPDIFDNRQYDYMTKMRTVTDNYRTKSTHRKLARNNGLYYLYPLETSLEGSSVVREMIRSCVFNVLVAEIGWKQFGRGFKGEEDFLQKLNGGSITREAQARAFYESFNQSFNEVISKLEQLTSEKLDALQAK